MHYMKLVEKTIGRRTLDRTRLYVMCCTFSDN